MEELAQDAVGTAYRQFVRWMRKNDDEPEKPTSLIRSIVFRRCLDAVKLPLRMETLHGRPESLNMAEHDAPEVEPPDTSAWSRARVTALLNAVTERQRQMCEVIMDGDEYFSNVTQIAAEMERDRKTVRQYIASIKRSAAYRTWIMGRFLIQPLVEALDDARLA